MFKSKKEPFKYFGQLNDGNDLEDFEQRSNLNNYLKSLGSVPKEDISLEKTNVTTEYLEVPVFEGRDYLKEAEQKDREMYIEFFGTDEEKESLRLEKEARKNKEQEAALLKEEEYKKALEQEALELEINEKALLLAKELEVKKRAEELVKQKSREEELTSKELKKITVGYEIMLNKLRNIFEKINKTPEDFWDIEDLATIKGIEDYIEEINTYLAYVLSIDSFQYKKEDSENYNTCLVKFNKQLVSGEQLVAKVSYLINRTYPVDVTLKLDKALYSILDYLFDYMESAIISNNYNFKVEQDYLDTYGNPMNYSIDIIKYDEKDTTEISFNFRHLYRYKGLTNGYKNYTQSFKSTNYKNVKVSDIFERVFVETISKQWHDYTPYKGKQDVKGIKSKFIEQTKLYTVRDNLASWKI